MYNPIEHTEIWYSTGNITYWCDLVTAWLGAYFVYLYDTFSEYPFVIKVAIISIIISILSILANFISLLSRSRDRRKRKRIKKDLRKRYGKGVRYCLSQEAKPNMSREEVLQALDISDNDNTTNLLRNDMERICFCRLLYKLRIGKDTVEGRGHNIKLICSIFELQPFLERKVNHGVNSERVECLRMMWAFRMPINAWIGNQLADNKFNRVRRMVTYATMASSTRSDLDYFESEFFEQNCCTYDEIQLGYTLQQRRIMGQKIPDLSHWVQIHKSPQAQCIFIRLMRKFNLADSCANLEELFQTTHDTNLIREIARTWGYLHYLPGEQIMADILFMQPDETKVSIIHALTRMNTGNSLDIITNTYHNSTSPYVRLEVLRCLHNYGTAGLERFKQLEADATPADTKIFAFFQNDIALARLRFSDSDEDEELYEDNMFSIK